MKPRFKTIGCMLLCAAPLAYLASIWKGLSAVVPTHFNAAGEANGFSSKETLVAIIAGLSLLTFGLYLLLNNLHRIDPKRHGMEPSGSFSKLADGLALFLTAINFVAVLASSGHAIAVAKIILVLVGGLIAFMGNVMYSLKPNYFAGIRLPWTLADDGNWRATHRLAGVLWFGGGIALVAVALLAGGKYMNVVLPAVLATITLIPVAYSFWYFKQHVRSGSAS